MAFQEQLSEEESEIVLGLRHIKSRHVQVKGKTGPMLYLELMYHRRAGEIGEIKRATEILDNHEIEYQFPKIDGSTKITGSDTEPTDLNSAVEFLKGYGFEVEE